MNLDKLRNNNSKHNKEEKVYHNIKFIKIIVKKRYLRVILLYSGWNTLKININ